MSAIKILKDNSNGKENTFIGILHEENKIDIPSFLTLFDAILEIVNNNLSNREVDRVIVKIHSFILNSIVNHLDKNDLFKISNYNTSISRNILERLNVIVESYFNGKKVQEEIFSDKLRSIKKIMKRISIDCSKISSLNDFHRVFSEVSEVPDYYGKNLDALWDVLTVDILGPVEFTFNSHSFFKSTNEDAFNKVIKVFNEAKQERGNDFIIVLK